MKAQNRRLFAILLTAAALSAASTASAANYSGLIERLEVWPSGNVSVTLTGVTLPCNGQVIVNQSSPGAKTIYATLLAAKIAGKAVTLQMSACVAADGYYPNVLYNRIDYLFLY